MFGISGMSLRGRSGRGFARAAGASLITGLAVLLGSSAAVATAAPQPRPAVSAVAGTLDGVACTSSTSCMAVGSQSSGGSLTERWNGTKWSVVSSPNPSGATGTTLWGVVCTAAKSCLAVGGYNNSTHTATLPTAEKWNGTKWSLITVPFPSGSTNASLRAVSCASAKDCQAVGVSGQETTLAESWNGTKWSIVSSPDPNPGKPNVLSGVACPSASLCWAVGYTFPSNFTGGLTAKWNGSKWSVVTTPASKSDEPAGDACFSASACLTVGITDNFFAFAESWNGTKWALTAAPGKPSGATGSELMGTACPAKADCEAVGNYDTSSGSATLAEGWNGTRWAIQTTPSISGASTTLLSGVSCPATSDCWAVGSAFGSSTSPIIEHWNGTKWSITAS